MITKEEFTSSIEGYEHVLNRKNQFGWNVYGTLYEDQFSFFVPDYDVGENPTEKELDDKAYEIYIKENE